MERGRSSVSEWRGFWRKRANNCFCPIVDGYFGWEWYNWEVEKDEVVKFWLESANEDWEFASEIWKSGRRLHNALFFAQLALEKILKALHYQKKEDHPLLTHDLVLLSKKLDLGLDKETLGDLREISSFNISARYDDYKYTFLGGEPPQNLLGSGWIGLKRFAIIF